MDNLIYFAIGFAACALVNVISGALGDDDCEDNFDRLIEVVSVMRQKDTDWSAEESPDDTFTRRQILDVVEAAKDGTL